MVNNLKFVTRKTQNILAPVVFGSLALLLLSACAGSHKQVKPVSKSDCHIVFDAGSSGTRLYIYQKSENGWLRYNGPKGAALADPARGNRGKTMADADFVTSDIVASLKRMPEGEFDFDWRSQCLLESVAVYATAGMRVAESQNPAGAAQLWALLNQKLSLAVEMDVTTRSVTGFEEGIYAWLAIREEQGEGRTTGNFGSSEMGGASAQVVFPCEGCAASRAVLVKGKQLRIFSKAYRGMGQDEVWKRLNNQSDCKHGVALGKPQWRVSDCTEGVVPTEEFESDSRIVSAQSDIDRWYLAGAFRYTKANDIDNYCRHDMDSGYEVETSCFRGLYQPYFLNLLGVPMSSEYSDADWTLGALICALDSCLSYAGPPECKWSAGGCL